MKDSELGVSEWSGAVIGLRWDVVVRGGGFWRRNDSMVSLVVRTCGFKRRMHTHRRQALRLVISCFHSLITFSTDSSWRL